MRANPTSRSMGLLLSCLVLVAAATSTRAELVGSAWAEQHASRVRLVAGGAKAAGGPSLAGLQIVLDEGWKTYWRLPGDAGVPPTFDWAGSSNVAAITVLYPAPQRMPEAGGVAVGYKQSVLLPIEVTPQDPAKPVALKLALEFGVCREILHSRHGEPRPGNPGRLEARAPARAARRAGAGAPSAGEPAQDRPRAQARCNPCHGRLAAAYHRGRLRRPGGSDRRLRRGAGRALRAVAAAGGTGRCRRRPSLRDRSGARPGPGSQGQDANNHPRQCGRCQRDAVDSALSKEGQLMRAARRPRLMLERAMTQIASVHCWGRAIGI